ncbi:MAG: hypothetical protein IPP77_02525 [Bacteroidetes bacterium]|nr:hypothetical protein [Bacteroidota bacterium]
MKKKQNKSGKPHSKERSSSADNNEQVLSVIKSLGNNADLKKLFPELEQKLSQEEIILALNYLDKTGTISIGQKGKIELLQNTKPRNSDRGSRKSGGDESQVQKYYFGTADVTRTGSAFVSVNELDRDVFIPNRYVRNTLQGDEVKIRITSFSRRPEGEIVAIIKRSWESFTGRIKVLDKFAFFIADEKNWEPMCSSP